LIQQIQDKYEQDMQKMREEMHQNFSQIISLINQNPQLANIKPEVLSKKVMIE
jgi:hypothetical protein